MIHRPHRLTDIMVLLRQYKLEPKRIRFVQPYADKEPTMVLVEAARGGKPMVKVVPVDAPSESLKRRVGFLKGAYVIPADVKAFGREEIDEMFHGPQR